MSGFHEGDVVGGYTVRRALGTGQMGQILEADDNVLQRRVAIKVPLHAQAAEGLLSEARALAAIQHPNLPVVHAAGEHGGLPFMVMERLYGTTLDAYVESAYAMGHPLGLPEAVAILGQVADALDAIHQAGVAHRDVKPENIILCGKRGPVLIDFGLVVPEYNQAQQRVYGGSPQYVSPEVIGRSEALGGGALSDLYSFGVTTYEVLTGRTPYDAADLDALLDLHVNAPVPDARMLRPNLPTDLASLASELMAKRAGERPQSAEEVVWRLQKIQKDVEGIAARARPTAMIVSSDPGLCGQVDVCLKSWVERVDVAVCMTSDAALTALEKQPPGLVLIDLELEGGTAGELLMTLAGIPMHPYPALVALKSPYEAAELDLLRRLGVACFVAKGKFLAHMLEPVVRNVLGTPVEAARTSRF